MDCRCSGALVLLAAGFWFLRRPAPAGLGKFSQLSFRPAYIRAARFAPGRTIVYAASVNGEPMTLFSTRTDTFEPTFNLTADLLEHLPLQRTCGFAGAGFDPVWTPTGRLAKVPSAAVIPANCEKCTDADWKEDGADLAIARRVGNQFRLEIPPAKCYIKPPAISAMSASPPGRSNCFPRSRTHW